MEPYPIAALPAYDMGGLREKKPSYLAPACFTTIAAPLFAVLVLHPTWYAVITALITGIGLTSAWMMTWFGRSTYVLGDDIRCFVEQSSAAIKESHEKRDPQQDS